MVAPLPTRPISDDEVETFWRDGVVCLRGVLDPAEVLAMGGPIAETLADSQVTTDMTELGEALASAGAAQMLVDDVARRAAPRRGHFRSGVDHWRAHPVFAAFATRSALPAIAATVLRSDRVWLYEDSVLVKEPGTHEPTAFHQDMSYFHVDGRQVCTTWAPLDPNDASTGAVAYVRGSHLWRELYRPNYFVTDAPIAGTDGDLVPDIRGRRGDYDLVSFETGPGDVVVHHGRTIHGADGNSSTERPRRAISVRFCGDDARYHKRRGAPLKAHHHHVADGDPLGGPDCPLVFPTLEGTS